MNPNIFRQIILAFVVATGLPYFVAMIIFQVLALLVVVIILAKLRAPEIAYKIVGTVVVFGLGLAVVATVGGWILFILECVTGILSLAVQRGYALTSPRVTAHSIDRYGNLHEVDERHPYLGPGRFAPQMKSMSDNAGGRVEQMAGYKHNELP